MKNGQKQQAKNLYFESNLTKTEIAARLGINRRTVMLWCQEGNWERIRNSSRHLPSMVAEKCYILLDQYANKFLDGFSIATFTDKHADAINKLASTIKKLKNRSATNESMEMFNFFLVGLTKKDPELAASVLPHIEEYLEARKDFNTNDCLPGEFLPDGSIPFNTTELEEKYKDQKDLEAFQNELSNADNNYDLALQNWQNPDVIVETQDFASLPHNPESPDVNNEQFVAHNRPEDDTK